MNKIIVIFLISLFSTANTQGQNKINFDSVFIQMIKPPSNCEEASILFPLDSASGKVISGTEISEQEIELNNLQTEINSSLNNFKMQIRKDMPKPPPGSGPPGGIPEINPDDFGDIKEIIDKRAKAYEKITISMNQFKNEILGNQVELNKNLKKTRMTEKDLRIHYVNEFLELSNAEYEKCFNIVLKNVNELESTFKFDKSSEKKNFPADKISLLKNESDLINYALLLFKVSKQLHETGSMFYFGIK